MTAETSIESLVIYVSYISVLNICTDRESAFAQSTWEVKWIGSRL